jgi:hypothetical protein
MKRRENTPAPLIYWRIRRGKKHEIPADAVLAFQDAIAINQMFIVGGKYCSTYSSTLSDEKYRALDGNIGELARTYPCRAQWQVDGGWPHDIPLNAEVSIVEPMGSRYRGRHVITLSESRLFGARFIKDRNRH